METITSINPRGRIRAALFDFDGTLSTLRFGWEEIMRPMMIEMTTGGSPNQQIEKEVSNYIDESTGIQTIFQMKWLVQAIIDHGMNIGMPTDPWWYKAEYNRRLMLNVEKRKQSLLSGEGNRDQYLVAGSESFLRALKEHGVAIYVASGTDHPDVVAEAHALGLIHYFDEIAGAPLMQENCSKEAVLRRLIEDNHLSGDEVAVIGDGKVEIELGKSVGARAIGLASDEQKLYGVNEVKRKKLIRAGADVIVGDFLEKHNLLNWLGLIQ